MLTDREADILDFEARPVRHAGRKETAVRDTFGLSFTRYYQLLNALIEREDALAADPVLVHRLRTARAVRSSARTIRQWGSTL